MVRKIPESSEKLPPKTKKERKEKREENRRLKRWAVAEKRAARRKDRKVPKRRHRCGLDF